MLTLGPMSGYDLKKLIEQSVAHFWSESYGQIYPILNQLAASGLAERRSEKQRGKPDRHVYSLTAKGREELARWLARTAPPEAFRSELLLKLFLGGAGSVSGSVAQVEHYQAHQRGLLETYERIEGQLRRDMKAHPDLPYWLITLRYGQRRARAMLAWCDETLTTLKRLRARRPERRRRTRR
jgi:DNA-binding PadR family transcriptional regulator